MFVRQTRSDYAYDKIACDNAPGKTIVTLPSSLQGRLRIPAIAAPMFLVSGPDLVVETCRSGLIGTFPALNQRTSQGYSEWLSEIKQRLSAHPDAAPFGINLIVHRSNPRVEADLAITVEHKVPLVITSLGAVADLVKAVHSYGGLVFHDVISLRHAREGGGSRCRRHHRGGGGRRRTCRHDIAIRAGRRNPPLLRQDHHPVGRDLEWRADRRGPRDGRRPRLSRHSLHRHAREHGGRRVQGR